MSVTLLTRKDIKIINKLMCHKGINKKDILEIMMSIYSDDIRFPQSTKEWGKLVEIFLRGKEYKKSQFITHEFIIDGNDREYYYIVTNMGISYVIKSELTISGQYDLLRNNKSINSFYCFYVVNELNKAHILTVNDIFIEFDGGWEECLKKIKGYKSVGRKNSQLYGQSFNADILWSTSGKRKLNRDILETHNKIENSVKYISHDAKDRMKAVGNNKFEKWIKKEVDVNWIADEYIKSISSNDMD